MTEDDQQFSTDSSGAMNSASGGTQGYPTETPGPPRSLADLQPVPTAPYPHPGVSQPSVVSSVPYSSSSNTPYHAPPANSVYSAPISSSQYANHPTSATYSAPPSSAPYSAPPSSAPYSAPSSSTPYSVPSSSAPYSAPPSSAPYATQPTSALYPTQPPSAPYSGQPHSAPYSAPPSSAPYPAQPSSVSYPSSAPHSSNHVREPEIKSEPSQHVSDPTMNAILAYLRKNNLGDTESKLKEELKKREIATASATPSDPEVGNVLATYRSDGDPSSYGSAYRYT